MNQRRVSDWSLYSRITQSGKKNEMRWKNAAEIQNNWNQINSQSRKLYVDIQTNKQTIKETNKQTEERFK